MMERGAVINRTHEVVLRLLPPYIITEGHVDTFLRARDQTLLDSTSETATV